MITFEIIGYNGRKQRNRETHLQSNGNINNIYIFFFIFFFEPKNDGVFDRARFTQTKSEKEKWKWKAKEKMISENVSENVMW